MVATIKTTNSNNKNNNPNNNSHNNNYSGTGGYQDVQGQSEAGWVGHVSWSGFWPTVTKTNTFWSKGEWTTFCTPSYSLEGPRVEGDGHLRKR